MNDSRETKKVVGTRRLKEAMPKPASLRILTVANQKGKAKRFGGRIGRRDHAKKAYVSLKPGQELNFSGEAA